jgi:biotin operon repressor
MNRFPKEGTFKMRSKRCLLACLGLLLSIVASAQQPAMPAEYSSVLTTLGRQGDFKDGVLKVNIPRSDLKVVVDGIATPTPFGFGGWVALTKGTGMDVMMGDLVLTEEEVNPVMSALLDAGLEVTAVHNHFFFETPRIFYMHVHGHGSPADLANKIKPALALIGKNPPRGGSTVAGRSINGKLDGAQLAKIIGTEGEQNGDVYKITIGRSDLSLKEMGATINSRMGLNTWAAFYGNDSDSVVAGDIAMVESEVNPVLKALRSNGIDVVAMHHHMIGTQPTIIFLHYWGKGDAQKLARGVRAAVDVLGKGQSASH